MLYLCNIKITKEDMILENMNIKEKAAEFVATIELNDNGIGFNYFERMIPTTDVDYSVLKVKMDNLMILLGKTQEKGVEAIKEFYDRDFEDDIWYDI
jgi:hypothetical protein